VTMELGWPLPKREDYFRDQIKNAKETHRIRFLGDYIILKIFSVPIGLPKYRLENGRTVSLQAEWLADHPAEAEDFFRRDPESDAAQEIQHHLLTKVITGAGLDKFFNDPANKQTDPVILDSHGFVINGNRRLCCWRELHPSGGPKFGHFSHVRVIVLPPADNKAIDRLEAELQVAKDIRDEYTWDTLANMLNEKKQAQGYSISQLAELYPERSQKDIVELLDMREYAIEYMQTRGKPNHWSLVKEHFHAFQEIVRGRSKQTSAAEKKVFEEVAFTLVDNPKGAGQRLYAVISKAATLMPDIINRLNEEIPEIPYATASVEPVRTGSDPTGFFDVGEGKVQSAADALVKSIRKGENGDTVREVVKDVVQHALEKEAEQKSTSYVRIKLQRANTEVQHALNGIDAKSAKTGVNEQILAIEKGLNDIRKWFNGNS